MQFHELKWWPNDFEGQGQRPIFSIPAESIPGCMFGANLVILAQICDELLRGQAEFPRILTQNGQNDLEGYGQWPPFSIPAESIPECMFGANLVIPAQTCDELSCRQGKDRRTDGQTQATTISLWPERPWGNKNYNCILLNLCEEKPLMTVRITTHKASIVGTIKQAQTFCTTDPLWENTPVVCEQWIHRTQGP